MRTFRVSLRYALRGMGIAWKGRNFRIQTLIGVIVLLAASLLGFTYPEYIAIVFAVALVLTAEMLNTVLEEVLDVIAPHFSEHVEKVKDLAAGVVLFLCLFAVIIGALTTWYHFVGWISPA